MGVRPYVGPCGFPIVAGYGGLGVLIKSGKNIYCKLEPNKDWMFEASAVMGVFKKSDNNG